MKDHRHPHQKQLINRMARVIGHAEAIKRMLEDEKECSDILIQIAAVKSALNNVGKLVLKDHINHCLVEAVETDDTAALEKLDEAIDKFMK
ncbi:MAG: metal-sensing transcriptional repressor [Bacillota bacterium]|nr:metal-sensing transcriptional repressor [Bacillota bacterium]MDW7678547.1 metal-sensing transcriptional repressor [Bacillota bacterium]